MMEMWEKNKRGRKRTGCLQSPYNKSLVTKYSKLNCSSSLYFPVVVFSKIKWFCRHVILWQLSGFFESWVKHLLNINRNTPQKPLVSIPWEFWGLSIGKHRKWEGLFLNAHGTVTAALQVSGYSAEAPQITRLITTSSKELYWKTLRDFSHFLMCISSLWHTEILLNVWVCLVHWTNPTIPVFLHR